MAKKYADPYPEKFSSGAARKSIKDDGGAPAKHDSSLAKVQREHNSKKDTQ